MIFQMNDSEIKDRMRALRISGALKPVKRKIIRACKIDQGPDDENAEPWTQEKGQNTVGKLSKSSTRWYEESSVHLGILSVFGRNPTLYLGRSTSIQLSGSL